MVTTAAGSPSVVTSPLEGSKLRGVTEQPSLPELFLALSERLERLDTPPPPHTHTHTTPAPQAFVRLWLPGVSLLHWSMQL